MELNEYQEKAMTTCMPSSDNFSYMMLNLVGEVGEFASKVAKAIRKEKADVNENVLQFGFTLSKEMAKKVASDENVAREVSKRQTMTYVTELDELKKEAGDVMWQIAGLCHVMGWTLEEVCQQNLDKLASRQNRGVIDGNGDNR